MSFTKILGSGISTETNLHVGVLTATKFIGDGSDLLNVTSGVGIQSGGSSVGSGITFLNFIGTGNTFALRGDVLDISISSGIIGINTAGISTFKDLNVSGNVSIAGTLTYEDVKNVDSIGLITARSGINVIAGGINASGIVTASSFDGNLTGNADTATYATSAGIATYATYATSAGIATYATSAGISTHASTADTATYASTAGIATNAQGLTGTPNIVVGVVTATSFSGDGSNLSNIISGVGIQSGGTLIGTGFTTLNFIGAGNTFAINGTTVDISITGGSGGGGGSAVNSYSNVLSSDLTLSAPNLTNIVEVDQDLTFDIEPGVELSVDEGCFLIIRLA